MYSARSVFCLIMAIFGIIFTLPNELNVNEGIEMENENARRKIRTKMFNNLVDDGDDDVKVVLRLSTTFAPVLQHGRIATIVICLHTLRRASTRKLNRF